MYKQKNEDTYMHICMYAQHGRRPIAIQESVALFLIVAPGHILIVSSLCF
jgi:hypothetical protein